MFSFLGYSKKTEEQPSTSTNHHDEDEDEDNEPAPIFPAQDSIQRATTTNKPTITTTTPPIITTAPILRIQSPDNLSSDEDEDDQDYLDQFDIHSTLELPHSTGQKPTKPRKQVHLMPGFSQLDWAKLKASGINLRGESVTNIRRITRPELAEHKTKEDAWSSFNGKVYNITPYLNYHPGGLRELMRVAGKDGTELFMKTHAWISIDGMLDCCLVGFLVN